MTIHDHFDGSAHCVECGGRCALMGDDLAVTSFVRFALEGMVYAGWRGLNMLQSSALAGMGVDPQAMMRRAIETNKRAARD